MDMLYSNEDEVTFCNLVMADFVDYFKTSGISVAQKDTASNNYGKQWSYTRSVAQFSVFVSPYTKKSRLVLAFLPGEILLLKPYSNAKSTSIGVIFIGRMKKLFEEVATYSYASPSYIYDTAVDVLKQLEKRLKPSKRRMECALERLEKLKQTVEKDEWNPEIQKSPQ